MFVGYSEVVNQHQSWLTEVTGLETGVRNSYLSDWLLSLGTWRAITTAKPLLADVGSSTPDVLMALSPVLRRLALPFLAVVGTVYATKYLVQKQNASASSQWRDVRQQIWGLADRDHPCLHYQSIRFCRDAIVNESCSRRFLLSRFGRVWGRC